MTLDVLGAFDRYELYAALIVDSETAQVAQLLTRVATLDPGLTVLQRLDLYRIANLNHGS